MNTNTLTASKLQAITNDSANITAMSAIFQAIAYCETLRPVIEGKKAEILTFYKFADKRTGETIDEPKQVYRLNDEDFEIYLKEMKAFYFSPACPVKPSKPDNCPLLEAESLVRETKRQVLELLAPQMGFEPESLFYNLKAYNQFWELMLSLFASKVKEAV